MKKICFIILILVALLNLSPVFAHNNNPMHNNKTLIFYSDYSHRHPYHYMYNHRPYHYRHNFGPRLGYYNPFIYRYGCYLPMNGATFSIRF